MQYLFIFFIASMVAIAAQAAEHYQVQTPGSYSKALQNLQHATIEVEKALERGDLHQVHQESYVMEAALERMQKELSVIAEEVEVMHRASEKKEKAKVEAALRKFQPSVGRLSAE